MDALVWMGVEIGIAVVVRERMLLLLLLLQMLVMLLGPTWYVYLQRRLRILVAIAAFDEIENTSPKKGRFEGCKNPRALE